MSLTPECHDLLALTLVPGLGPRLIQALLSHFGSATQARQASVQQMQQVPHIGPLLARQFVESLATVDVGPELALAGKHGVTLLPLTSADYPPLLREIADAPPLLYLRGAVTPADGRAVALVGSRQCSALRQENRGAPGFGTGASRHHRDLGPGTRRRWRGPSLGLAGQWPDSGRAGQRPGQYLPAGTSRPGRPGGAGRGRDHRGPHGAGTAGGLVPGPQPHHQRPVARGGPRRGGGQERRADHGHPRRFAGSDGHGCPRTR